MSMVHLPRFKWQGDSWWQCCAAHEVTALTLLISAVLILLDMQCSAHSLCMVVVFILSNRYGQPTGQPTLTTFPHHVLILARNNALAPDWLVSVEHNMCLFTSVEQDVCTICEMQEQSASKWHQSMLFHHSVPVDGFLWPSLGHPSTCQKPVIPFSWNMLSSSATPQIVPDGSVHLFPTGVCRSIACD